MAGLLLCCLELAGCLGSNFPFPDTSEEHAPHCDGHLPQSKWEPAASGLFGVVDENNEYRLEYSESDGAYLTVAPRSAPLAVSRRMLVGTERPSKIRVVGGRVLLTIGHHELVVDPVSGGI